MKFMTNLFPALATCTALLLGSSALAADAPTADTVLAKVGDIEITVGNMIALRSGLPAQYAQVPAEMLFPGMLDQLIQHALLSQKNADGLSKLGALSLENEKRAILAEDEAQKIANAAVTDEAINAVYEANYANAPQEAEYRASHILVGSEEEAAELVKALEEGADFAELAKEKSTGPSGPNGGDLGWFSDGMMVEPFFAAVTALKPGEVSGPVKTDFGWHVIRLAEVRDQPRPTLDEVREEIIAEIQQEAVTAYIQELESQANVERTSLDGFDFNVINTPDLLEK